MEGYDRSTAEVDGSGGLIFGEVRLSRGINEHHGSQK